MRQCVKTLNFSYLSGLIEEAQSMGNRMEAKLDDMRDHKRLTKEVKELEDRRVVLREELKDLGDKPKGLLDA
jgi:predicted  nucleic acid-binding Zn-ribbon protein